MGVVGETVTYDNHERSTGARHGQHRVSHIAVGVGRVLLDDIGSRQVRDEQSRYEPGDSSHGLTVINYVQSRPVNQPTPKQRASRSMPRGLPGSNSIRAETPIKPQCRDPKQGRLQGVVC